MNLDPEKFGMAIGKAIKDAVAPLKERLDALEQKQERGIRFRGKFQPADSYRPGDVVSFDESLWSCAKDTDGGDRPGPDSTTWALMLRGK